jgi:hypothetical protein
VTYTNNSLANHDTDNLEVGDTGNPVVRALGGLFLVPALRPGSLEERLKVANGEEDVTLETETSTGNDCMAEIPRERRERILLEHAPGGSGLLAGSLLVNLVDEAHALGQRQISPVDTVLIV